MDWHTKILEVLVFMPGFLFSLSVHEAAHGFVAWRFGDSTAKDLGRVTVNPVPHIDVLGTLILPILGLFTGFLFGWGKPVPVDYRNLKNVKRDGLYIAAAGPVSNMILAFGFAGLVHLALINETVLLSVVSSFVYGLIVTGLVQFVFLNLALCFFNLIPVQP
ncbi:MAG: site-2 protease family protein [Deltaproteobacteria bacterium]|nr:site-2 protease family protein [Deltaproteobacteria bacterium]